MKELFIIAGFLALLANIFYCVFWVSREIWIFFTDGNKEIKEDLDRFAQQEEYLKVLHSDFDSGKRPWSLSIPTDKDMIDAAREQIKKHGYTEFGVDFGKEPDSHGNVYPQDAIDSMKMAMEANSKGILDNFQDIDKVWLLNDFIDHESGKKIEKYDPRKLVKDEMGTFWYDKKALIETISTKCVKGKEYFVRDRNNFCWCVADIVDLEGVHFIPKDKFKLSLFVHHEDMINVYEVL